MDTFLKETIEALKNKYHDLGNVTLIFPNRRPVLYIKKYLAETLTKPGWAPGTLTINEFIQDLSGLEIRDNITLVLKLYEHYKHHKKSYEPIDEFFYWGEILLSDFDDIDKYLVDAADLFKNIESFKSFEYQFSYLSENQISAIKEFWKSFSPEKYSDQQKEFISLWNILHQIYKDFRERLFSNKEAYEGMAYRHVAETISNINFNTDRNFIFIGFNALNRCEQKIFKHLNNKGLAEFIWDYDLYYLENDIQEAGNFIRDNLAELGKDTYSIRRDHLTKDKNISVYAVPSSIGQCKLIPIILEGLNIDNSIDPNTTAIVLPDETLLTPLISSIPNTYPNINITMGLTFPDTQLFALIDSLLALQLKIKDKQQNVSYYYKDIFSILKHPYIKTGKEEIVQNLYNQLKSKNQKYIRFTELPESDTIKKVFSKPENGILNYLKEVLHQLYQCLSGVSNEILSDKEIIYQTYLAISRLSDSLKDFRQNLNMETLIRLIKKALRSITIPFSGEPLSGIQIMGILETRTIDFENLIVLSMNEGTLPKVNVSSSFIPYNLRRGFGMPTIEHQDAIYAYYFYRLIQRSKNVHLVYNSTSEGLRSGEKSRYIYQLLYESGQQISENFIKYNVGSDLERRIEIEKNEQTIEKLLRYAEPNSKYLSPSAIITYLTCSLKFYFRYIIDLREPEEIIEEVDAQILGNILHEAMHYLYKPFIGQVLETEHLKELQNNKKVLITSINEAYKKEYKATDQKTESQDAIMKKIIHQYVEKIIETDLSFVPLTIRSLEEEYHISLPVMMHDKKYNFIIGGKIDRIDETKNTIRIIDYKTGYSKNTFKEIAELFNSNTIDDKKAIFQILLYSKLFSDNVSTSKPITPGIYNTKELFANQFTYHIKQNNKPIEDYSTNDAEFTALLAETLEEIMNIEIPFQQTENIKNQCSNCEFKGICNR